jgi:hypothetical protein
MIPAFFDVSRLPQKINRNHVCVAVDPAEKMICPVWNSVWSMVIYTDKECVGGSAHHRQKK